MMPANLVHMGLSDRIVARRKAVGINTQTDFAKRLGVSQQTVYSWESNGVRTLRGDNLTKAAKILDVNETWLLTGVGPMDRTAAIDAPQQGYMRILRLENFDDFEQPGLPPYIDLPEFVVRSKVKDAASLDRVRWAINPGPAMAPEIERGDLTFVDTSIHSPSVNGAVYAFRLWNAPDIQRIQIRGDKRYRVHGGPDYAVDLQPADATKLEIRGMVVGWL